MALARPCDSHILRRGSNTSDRFDEMVNVVKGSLIKCDPAVKQYLVHLDETKQFGEKFILNNLDDQHLFVQSSSVAMIKEKLKEQMDKISYDPAQTK